MSQRHTHSPHPGQEPWHDLPAGLAEHLEREARLSTPILDKALTAAATALATTPTTIVDLGAGTGAGTIALATRFPEARIHSLDVSAELLERLRTAAAAADVADRVHSHQVDLDGDWPAALPAEVDLVWAALSLHHVADPAKVLRQAGAALRPGGVLVLTELSGTETFEPADLGSGRPGLDDRLLSAPTGHSHPAATDWTGALAEAGFAPVQHHEHTFAASGQSPDGARYLMTRLQAHRDQLVDDASSDDRAAVDGAIDALDAGTSDLSFTAGRAVWVATRPEPAREQVEAEVVVVGGGSAGLAAAVALARSRRDVVVIDAGQPRNAPAEGAHNVLGNEGISPLDLLARGRAEAHAYGVRFMSGHATAASGAVDDFTIEVDGGSHLVHARRLVLATGLVDDLPDVPGVAQAWGHTVLHCPFCHGWEVRDQRIAILARDEVAVHQALLFRQLSEQVTLFLHQAAEPTEEQWEQLAALDVSVVRPRVERLVVDGTQVRAVEIEGGRTFEADAVVIAPKFHARTELFEGLGGEPTATPFGRQIQADQRGMTAIPGVWAIGNASEPMAMLMTATAAGVTAGAAVHGDLAFSDLGRAVQARRVRR
ncbi:FAD-dependent oxidoreductase [Ruania zhangjianzhongii]|uniref:FAD-dependent oxidoreductase n=1 Tax=Ruania zhangjianzhongii TaxID=2603206 RepID=UPI0011CB8523|nr:FAD-dependent oxidoreductase [Ruania zhangjianzhongii]